MTRIDDRRQSTEVDEWLTMKACGNDSCWWRQLEDNSFPVDCFRQQLHNVDRSSWSTNLRLFTLIQQLTEWRMVAIFPEQCFSDETQDILTVPRLRFLPRWRPLEVLGLFWFLRVCSRSIKLLFSMPCRTHSWASFQVQMKTYLFLILFHI